MSLKVRGKPIPKVPFIPGSEMPEPSESLRQVLKSCQAGYNGPGKIDYEKLSPRDIDEMTKKLVAEAFRVAGADPKDHPQCFQACVFKCINTKAYEHERWMTWAGHRVARQRLEELEALAISTNKRYCLVAPTLVSILVMKEVRRALGRGSDGATRILHQYDLLALAATAIHHYQVKGSNLIEIECPQSPDNGLTALGPDKTVRVSQSQDGLEEEEDVLLDDGISVYPSVSLCTVTREQMTACYGSLYDKLLFTGDWSTLNGEISEIFNENNVKVLPRRMKDALVMWARQQNHLELLQWIQAADEDLETHTWQEAHKKAMPQTWRAYPTSTSLLDDLDEIAKYPEQYDMGTTMQTVSTVVREYVNWTEAERRDRNDKQDKLIAQLQESLRQGYERQLAMDECQKEKLLDLMSKVKGALVGVLGEEALAVQEFDEAMACMGADFIEWTSHRAYITPYSPRVTSVELPRHILKAIADVEYALWKKGRRTVAGRWATLVKALGGKRLRRAVKKLHP